MITFVCNQEEIPKEHRLAARVFHLLASEMEKVLPEVHGIVHVNAVSEEEIRRLNRAYRGKDKVTDVLSFPLGDVERSGELGDVLVCFAQAARQTEEGVQKELLDLIIHGTLHVLGYDHEESEDAAVMFPLQDGLYDALVHKL